jgi:DNA invertase Pin-like site-specific DNA recombinase
MRQIGYARVSTTGQDYNGQIAALEAAGCVKIYREKITGARADRPELAKMLRALEPGDAVVVARLDRLAQSTRDLLNLLDEIGKAGASFRSLADAWADTTTPHGRLMLTVLGGLAEFERTLIATRTGDGRERAKARGVRFGRPRKLSAHQLQEAVSRIDAGEPLADIARSYNVDATTIGRLKGACAF